MIPAPLLLLWKYRRLAGYAVAAVALAVVAWRIAAWHKAYTELPQVKESLTAERKGRAADAKAWKDEVSAYTARLAKQEADTAALSASLVQAQDRAQSLQNALSRARLVNREPSPVPGDPPVVRLSRAVRLCVNAAITDTPADAADCQAVGMRVPAAAGNPDPR